MASIPSLCACVIESWKIMFTSTFHNKHYLHDWNTNNSITITHCTRVCVCQHITERTHTAVHAHQ